MHAAYRVIGPSAAGDRHFGVVFQRIFSASPGVPPRALDRQRTARRRRRRERPDPTPSVAGSPTAAGDARRAPPPAPPMASPAGVEDLRPYSAAFGMKRHRDGPSDLPLKKRAMAQ